MVGGNRPERADRHGRVGDLRHVRSIERLIAHVAEELAARDGETAADVVGGEGVEHGELVLRQVGHVVETDRARNRLEVEVEVGFHGIGTGRVLGAVEDGVSRRLRLHFLIFVGHRGVAADRQRIIDLDISVRSQRSSEGEPTGDF